MKYQRYIKQYMLLVSAGLIFASAASAQAPATGTLDNGLRYVIQPASPPCEPSNQELLFGFAECAPAEAQSAIVTIMGGDASVDGYVVTLVFESTDGVTRSISRTVKRTAFSASAGFETGRMATSRLPGVRVKQITVGIVAKAATATVQ